MRTSLLCTKVIQNLLRYDLTDIARIAFMFNGGQSPASIHSNRLNYETYAEPCFPAPQLYLLSHTLKCLIEMFPL